MKEIKNKIPTVIVTGIATYIILYYLFNYWSDGIYSRFNTRVGLDLFYMFQSRIYSYLIIGALSTFFIVDIFYRNKQSKFQNMVITRTGYIERMKYEVCQVIKCSFIIKIIFNLFLVIIIHLFMSKIRFYDCTSYCQIYSQNPLLSFIIQNIYSCIGFSVFNLFIYSISYFIKNQHMYKVSGIISIIGFTCLMSIVGNALIAILNDASVANPFFQAFFPLALITPGINTPTTVTTTFGEHFWYFYTCACFAIYSLILIEIRKKKERKNG